MFFLELCTTMGTDSVYSLGEDNEFYLLFETLALLKKKKLESY